MVTYSARDARLDAVFAALADPTRRAILRRLTRGRSRPTELAQPFDVSLPAISKHLRVLESAGLVTRERDGRTNHVTLRTAPLDDAARWLETMHAFWQRQLDGLARHLRAK